MSTTTASHSSRAPTRRHESAASIWSTSSTASATPSGSCNCSVTSWRSTRAPTVRQADRQAASVLRRHQAVGTTVAAPRATARPGSSGTPRARASPWRWSCTPIWSGQPELKNPTHRRRHRPHGARQPALRDLQPLAAARRVPGQVTTARQLRTELPTATPVASTSRHCRSSGSPRPNASRADHPLLTDRRNVIVIVDEAHRSHYDDLDGYARHIRDALPNAAFIAFTGTPLSFADRNTQDVFGNSSTSTTSPVRSTTAPRCRSTSSPG